MVLYLTINKAIYGLYREPRESQKWKIHCSIFGDFYGLVYPPQTHEIMVSIYLPAFQKSWFLISFHSLSFYGLLKKRLHISISKSFFILITS